MYLYFFEGGGLAFFCQKTWGVAYTRGAAYTSEYGSRDSSELNRDEATSKLLSIIKLG